MKKFVQQIMLLGCLLFGVAQLQAQATLSVQGTMQNFNGTTVDNGGYDILFKLYTAETGGTPVWSETQTVQVVNGVYSVLLGAVNPLTAAFDVPYFLGTTLPGGPELIPRSPLTSSPYALSLIGQNNKFPSTGNVGIGTTAPTTSLDANGSISTATVTTSAAAYTVLAADHVVFLDLAGAQAVTLPSAATFPRREIVLINKTSTAKTVSIYVDLAGAAATAIPANGMIELRSNGTEWRLATTFAPSDGAAKAYVYCRGVASAGGGPTNSSAAPFQINITERSDPQSCYNNGIFTAPRTGVYHISGQIYTGAYYWNNASIMDLKLGGTCQMGVDGVFVGNVTVTGAGSYSYIGFPFSADVQMTAGQTLSLNYKHNSGTNGIYLLDDTGNFLTIREY